MDTNKASKFYPKLLRDIQEVFRKHDPSGLFSLGVPNDEHDDDINRIVSELQHVSDPEEVPVLLKKHLGEWINSAGKDPSEVCQRMASPIWDAWCEFRNNTR